MSQQANALEYCNTILPYVSRSFALGINTLKGHLRKNVLIGYLLCRIADTIEDDLHLSSETKCVYLIEFNNCFTDKSKSLFISKIARELKGNPHHVDLVQNTHYVFEVYETLSKNSQLILKKWVEEMSNGMIKYLKKYPFGIRISNMNEYKEYCYFVAGTVGYMLTDLWKEFGLFINENKHSILYKSAGTFGEALQTINILKDITWDMKNENSVYIPKNNFDEKSILEIVELAQADLQISLEYIQNIPLINKSIRFFCIFPLLLAIATLREIKKSSSVLNPAQVIKVSRAETKQIYKHSFISSFSNYWLKKSAKNLANLI